MTETKLRDDADGLAESCAEPDEPMFVLLGRAALLVGVWAAARAATEGDSPKVREALACSAALEAFAWGRGKDTDQASAAILTSLDKLASQSKGAVEALGPARELPATMKDAIAAFIHHGEHPQALANDLIGFTISICVAMSRGNADDAQALYRDTIAALNRILHKNDAPPVLQ